MPAFATWLREQPDNDQLNALREFARQQGADWPYWSNEPSQYTDRIALAPEANRAALNAAFATYYARWNAEQEPRRWWNILFGSLGKIALFLFGVAFLVILTVALFSQEFYESLARVEQVRGMVTFFFVLSTTGIIVLFALSIFWLDSGDEVTKRFGAAKDLLTIVIGVLGTIMGFYFGTATGGGANLAVTSAAVSPLSVEAGAKTKLSARVIGGTKPYKYSVVFGDPSAKASAQQLTDLKVTNADAADGAIEKDVTAPTFDTPVVLFFTITATDSKSTTAQSSGALFVQAKKP